MAPRNPQILVGVEGLKPQDLFHTFAQGYGIMVSMLRIKNVKQKESEIEKIEAELEKSKKTSEQLKSELDRINRSKTFRLGKLIMYVPVRLKGFLRRNAQNS